MPQAIHQTVHQERLVAGGRRLDLSFRTGADPVPAILLLPEATTTVAGAVLLHGYSSRKEHMADAVGEALLARGVASLAIDLPLHGSRANPVQAQATRNPLHLVRHWRDGLAEAKLAVHYLAARAETDAGRIGLVGYSMGAFLGTIAAADEARVRAVVLAAGGDLPSGSPFAALARSVADPVRAVRRLSGRPLLMVHGRHDTTVRPEQAERLFAAASEPKQLRWWNAGHFLPPAAIAEAAGWLAEQLNPPA